MRGCRARSFSAVNGSSEKEKVEVEVGLATRGLAPALPDFGELSRAVPVPFPVSRTVREGGWLRIAARLSIRCVIG
jgi:hypothetical protein